MTPLYRTMAAIVTGTALLAVTGCGPGGLAGDETSESTAPPPKQGLANIDPCSILKPNEVADLGLREPQPVTDVSSEPGCDFLGDPFGAALHKNQKKTVESYSKQSNWARFDSTDVNGRTAAEAIDASAQKEARLCITMFNAGGGVIIVTSNESNPGNLDECAESHKIAEMIEPRMPE